MIISFSGKLGSGKDSVAKIIQELDPVNGWTIKKWAGKLKDVASILAGVPVEMWEDQYFKFLPMSGDWNMSYREFLQKLGTEGLREGLHKNVWVNALMHDYIPGYDKDEVFNQLAIFGEVRIDPVYPNWLITDTRFPNEADAVKKRNGICVVVKRACPECGGWGHHKMSCGYQYRAANVHKSETSLDDYTFDYVIENRGDLDDLKNETIKFLEYVRSKNNQESRV